MLNVSDKFISQYSQVFFFFHYWQHLKITSYPKMKASINFICTLKCTNAYFFLVKATNYKDVTSSLNLMQLNYNTNSTFSGTNNQ